MFSFRPSERCLAPSAPREFESKLPARVESKRQGVLTVGKWRAAAYLRVCRVELVFSAADMCIAPSAPMSLSHKLPTVVELKEKQTSGGADGRKTVCGDVLELLQGGVGLEGVRDVLCRLSIKPVVAQTASESQKETLGC